MEGVHAVDKVHWKYTKKGSSGKEGHMVESARVHEQWGGDKRLFSLKRRGPKLMKRIREKGSVGSVHPFQSQNGLRRAESRKLSS